MSTLPEFPQVSSPDPDAFSQAEDLRKQVPAEFGMPAGSLGRLEQLGPWLSACQEQVPPRELKDVRLVVVAGEHGVAVRRPEVSALPETFTRDAFDAIRAGRSPLLSAARSAGVSVSLIDANLSRPSGEIDHEDAMNSADLERHLRQGMSVADEEADQGTQLLLLGDLGRGLTTVSAAVIGSICGIEPVRVIGRGSGIGDDAWRVKIAAIRDAMYRVRDDRDNAERVLRKIGGPDLAVMTGLLAQAAVRRTPVLIDGVGAAAAALCAQMLAPGASDWWQVASAGKEPAVAVAHSALQAEPLLQVGLSTGQGAGTLMALPILRYAVDALASE